MTLYFVHEPGGGDDLLTRNHTPKQAVQSYATYYELDVEREDEGETDLTVHRCDADLMGSGAIEWDSAEGMVRLGTQTLSEWIT